MAFNLNSAMKRLALGGEWMSRIGGALRGNQRAAGSMSRGHPGYPLLCQARQRILALAHGPPWAERPTPAPRPPKPGPAGRPLGNCAPRRPQPPPRRHLALRPNPRASIANRHSQNPSPMPPIAPIPLPTPQRQLGGGRRADHVDKPGYVRIIALYGNMPLSTTSVTLPSNRDHWPISAP